MKYNERLTYKSMDPEVSHELVQLTRRESKRLMAERENEIDAGLVHLTPAMVDDIRRVTSGTAS